MSGIPFSELLFGQCFSVYRTVKELLGHGQVPVVVSPSAVCAEPRAMLCEVVLRALPALDILCCLCILLQAQPCNLCSF